MFHMGIVKKSNNEEYHIPQNLLFNWLYRFNKPITEDDVEILLHMKDCPICTERYAKEYLELIQQL